MAAVATEAFRFVHGEIGAVKEVLDVDARGAHRDADTAADARVRVWRVEQAFARHGGKTYSNPEADRALAMTVEFFKQYLGGDNV